MANKHTVPPYHPMLLVSYGVMVAGFALFLSTFFSGMGTGMGRAVGGFGLIALGAILRGAVEWSWNNAQPVITVRARVTSKWTTTSGGGDTATTTHYHARFQPDTGDALDFNIALDLYRQFGEGDSGALTYQGSRIHGFART